jgi:hypothetical protein
MTTPVSDRGNRSWAMTGGEDDSESCLARDESESLREV